MKMDNRLFLIAFSFPGFLSHQGRTFEKTVRLNRKQKQNPPDQESNHGRSEANFLSGG
jgi:hypothetical protein